MEETQLRKRLTTLLKGGEAHRGFNDIVEGLPAALRGRQPDGLPHSPWQLLEHMRIAQQDILAFCQRPDYESPDWPDEYWPSDPNPPTPAAWEESITAFRSDLQTVIDMAENPEIDLGREIPHGNGQTYLREVLLVADHNAYHLGQLVMVRRLLGSWPPRAS